MNPVLYKTGDQRGLSAVTLLICGIITAFFLLCGFLGIEYLKARWSPSLKTVRRLVEKKNYGDALAVIERAENGKENNAPLLIEKGRVWFSLALEREQRSRWRRYGKDSGNWLNSPEAEKAERYLKKAIALNPADKNGHYYLGLLYMEKGHFSAAETEFLDVVHRDRSHADALINLGVVYTELRRFDLAEEELRKALAIEPENPDCAKNLAILFRFYLDKPDSAMAWANRYLNLEPRNDRDINFVRKELEEMLKRYPEFTPPEPMHWNKPPVFKARFGNRSARIPDRYQNGRSR